MKPLRRAWALLLLAVTFAVPAQDEQLLEIPVQPRTTQEVQAAIVRDKDAFARLFLQYLKRHPGAQSAKMIVSFTVAPEGKVTAASIVDSPFRDAELEAGVLAQLYQLRFQERPVPEFTHPGFPIFFALPGKAPPASSSVPSWDAAP